MQWHHLIPAQASTSLSPNIYIYIHTFVRLEYIKYYKFRVLNAFLLVSIVLLHWWFSFILTLSSKIICFRYSLHQFSHISGLLCFILFNYSVLVSLMYSQFQCLPGKTVLSAHRNRCRLSLSLNSQFQISVISFILTAFSAKSGVRYIQVKRGGTYRRHWGTQQHQGLHVQFTSLLSWGLSIPLLCWQEHLKKEL